MKKVFAILIALAIVMSCAAAFADCGSCHKATPCGSCQKATPCNTCAKPCNTCPKPCNTCQKPCRSCEPGVHPGMGSVSPSNATSAHVK